MVAALLLLITLPAGGPTVSLAALKLTRALVIPGACGCWLGMIVPLGVGEWAEAATLLAARIYANGSGLVSTCPCDPPLQLVAGM